mmetsp:Transcript_28209/g.71342  ORF Transcript_28209/g.71342 Transcript_28209/m.71342 type:complete len:208 (-) Transcript_28209:163-786(-)
MRWSRASKTCAIGYMRFNGTSLFRSSVKGECNEKAMFTCGSSSVSFRMPGMTPTVETLIRRDEKPYRSGSVRTLMASKTLGLASGSPMPIIEMPSTFCWRCRKWSTWSVISSASSCRLSPTFPVAQNAHWKAHPIWEEMQSDLCDLNCSETASTRAPSRCDFSSTFCAWSPSELSPLSKEEMYLPNRSFKRILSPVGSWSMSCHFAL